MQQQKQKRYANGYIDFILEGSLNNQPTSLNLTDISKQKRADLSFNFQYFQIVEGEITLPKGFKPEQILLSATLPKGRWQQYSRLNETYKWVNIIEKSVLP